MHAVLLIILFCGWLSATPKLPPQITTTSVSSSEAKNHLGERLEVCGLLAEVREPRRANVPTYLNFGGKFPQQEFSAVIWKWQRPVFLNLHIAVGHKVCVIGQVREYRDKPQITLTKAEQLRVSD